MNQKPGLFATVQDSNFPSDLAAVYVLAVVIVVAWVTLFAQCARGDGLIDLEYRAYDRVPANADLTKFRSEDYSERKASGAILTMFRETLMPSDDWLFLDGPMAPRIDRVQREHCEDFYLRQLLAPGTEPLTFARLAEIPQEHPWMAEHKGKFRCYVAYLPAPASFPDTITVVAGAFGRCVPVWRSGKEPRSE